MKEWIKNLLALQTSDLRIKKNATALKGNPWRKKRNWRVSFQVEKQKSNKQKKKLREVEKEIKKIESKVDGFKGKINALQDKSVMIKKNDEYKALLNEIHGHKVSISGLEDKEIGLIDKLEAKKRSIGCSA